MIIAPHLDVNVIHENLYQGAWPPGGDTLAKLGFHVLVLTARENQGTSRYTGLEDIIVAPGDDDTRPHRLERFLPMWKDAAHRVVAHVRNRKNVVVTCMAGQNRSGFVVALALQELTGWSGAKCVDFIQSRRMWALNNETFAQYIIDTFKDPQENEKTRE